MKKVILLLFACASWFAVADSQEVIKDVEGVGKTRQEAVTNALLEAVQQIRGLEVTTNKTLQLDLSSIVNKDGSAITTVTESTDVKAFNRAHGWVNTYKMLDTSSPDDKQAFWKVKLRVSVPLYKPLIAEDQRRTLAIPLFNVSARQLNLYDASYSAHSVSRHLVDSLIYQLSRLSIFAVLNRSFYQQLEAEKDIWKSEGVPSAAAIRLGQKLGADLMLLGRIHRFDIVDADKHFYGADVQVKKVDVDVFYSVVEAATEKILWSGQQSLDVEYKENQYEEYERNYVTDVINDLARAITNDIADAFIPIRILENKGAQKLVLNQGQQRLTVGQQLLVYARGTSRVDPNSGLSIDIKGSKIATLEVVAVDEKYAEAKLIDGSADNISADVVIETLKPVGQSTKPTMPPARQTPGSSEAPLKW